MYASVLNIVTMWILCGAIAVNEIQSDIIAKTKIQLVEVHLSCKLNNMVVITAPIVDCKAPLYYLYKPNGESIKLDIPRSYNEDYNRTEIVQYEIDRDIQTRYVRKNYRIIDLNRKSNIDLEATMGRSDFFIGPLTTEDHGNWMLSTYCKDIDDNWIEIFQTITIEITESVPIKVSNPHPELGDTVELSFAYPIRNLESCELVAPRTTFDRYFDRNRFQLDQCSYILPNITRLDEGTWKIIGVGQIVYEGKIKLKIANKKIS